MPEHLLEVDSVRYGIGERQLLTDIFLTCKTGEVVGLLGRNGCGKSTLLKIVFGTVATANKFIRIDGVVHTTPFTTGKLVAYLPQHSFLPKRLQVSKIIDLWVPHKEDRRQLKLDEEVIPHLPKSIDELSGGERRYLEILLLLHLNSCFVLLDEPFSGIEPLYIEKIHALLQAHRRKTGFILTDHNYRSILKVSDRVLLLHDGSIREVNSPDELEHWGYVPPGSL